jgi:hypothetical protein
MQFHGSAITPMPCCFPIEPDMLEPMAQSSVKDINTMKGVSMRRLLLVSAAACLLASQTANAAGCLEGAAIGGAVGHMSHHTFLGLFGGCAGGRYVHQMYSKWKRNHPNGTMNEFVSDNKEYLPSGWADRLTTPEVGEANIRPGTASKNIH